MIDVSVGRLVAVRQRLWPKSISRLGVWWQNFRSHARRRGDYCRLYYSQPAGMPRYLALKFVVSRRDTTLKTFRGALRVLDEIARIKGSDAIVCEAGNSRISDRLLRRWGWEPHVPSNRRRHYIKRFYGNFADESLPLELRQATVGW